MREHWDCNLCWIYR